MKKKSALRLGIAGLLVTTQVAGPIQVLAEGAERFQSEPGRTDYRESLKDAFFVSVRALNFESRSVYEYEPVCLVHLDVSASSTSFGDVRLLFFECHTFTFFIMVSSYFVNIFNSEVITNVRFFYHVNRLLRLILWVNKSLLPDILLCRIPLLHPLLS